MNNQNSAIYDLLKKLEIVVEKGFPILPNYLVALKVKDIEFLIDSIYGALPKEISEARALLRRREEIQAESQQRAEKIILDAQNEASRLLSESNIMKKVQEEAERIKEDVIKECEEIKRKAHEDAENFRIQAADDAIRTREGAESYAETILSHLEQTLVQHQQIVRNGQIYMEKLRAENAGGYDPLKHNYPQGTDFQDAAGNFKIMD